MAVPLTHEEFSKHLNTTFRIRINETERIDAQLIDVSELMRSPHQERFSILFRAANDNFLGQGTRRFEHDDMEAFDLFIVPIARDEEGTKYEAIFNRLVEE